jgi:Methyltransferase domain
MKQIIKTLLGFNAVSFVHLVRLNPRAFSQSCKRAFNVSWYTQSSRIEDIPEVSLRDILGDRKPVIRHSIARYEDGMLPFEEATVLLAILVAEAPKEVLEIGTYMGHTTQQMAENLESAIIHTVDLPEEFAAQTDSEKQLPKDDFHLINTRVVGREFKNRPCAARVIQHFGDTATWDFRAAGRPTFFFIDGSHTYEYCKSDSEKSLALAGEGAVFLWHDCDDRHPGVVKFVAEWRSRGIDIRRISGTSIAYWKRT